MAIGRLFLYSLFGLDGELVVPLPFAIPILVECNWIGGGRGRPVGSVGGRWQLGELEVGQLVASLVDGGNWATLLFWLVLSSRATRGGVSLLFPRKA